MLWRESRKTPGLSQNERIFKGVSPRPKINLAFRELSDKRPDLAWQAGSSGSQTAP